MTKTGLGNGRVTSSPTGINCGQTCVATYVNGTAVTLTATPNANSRFRNWSGACTGSSRTCVVSMTSDLTVTARFARRLAPCVVPNVVGMTVGKARSKIARSHCAVGSITHRTSTAGKKGKVLAQTPRPGRRLKHGAKLTLAVGKGPTRH